MAAHNPFLHLFEADKEVVYLDFNALTIVEKTFAKPIITETSVKQATEEEPRDTTMSSVLVDKVSEVK